MKKEVGKSKEAQVTVFVIVAVLIFLGVAVAALFLVKDNRITRDFINRNSVSSEIMPVYESIDVCAEQRTIDAIRIVGLQGGYVSLPKNYLATSISNIAYGYYSGKNTFPAKQEIENEINSYVETVMPFCIADENLVDFSISSEKPSVTTKLNQNNVEVTVSMIVFATKNNETYKLDKSYYSEVPIRLGDMIDVANEIVEKEIREPESVPISYLANLQYTVFTLPYDEENLVYIITDISEDSKINNATYSFLFANKLK